MLEFIILTIPLVGTSLGASAVLFLKDNVTDKTEKALLGFASGVMLAALVWSLIIPATEMSAKQGIAPWIPAIFGFILGILFLIVSDIIISKLRPDNKSEFSKVIMLIFAVTLHNIPEGMAVGVAFAATLNKLSGISVTAAFALSLGIAIQNFPEGAIISMPLITKCTKPKAFLCGVLSGVVEPIFGFITVIFVSKLSIILPFLLCFAAGAMFYVVIEELIPEAKSYNVGYTNVIFTSIGFSVMMLLDIALG